jgi:hypothetical protein
MADDDKKDDVPLSQNEAKIKRATPEEVLADLHAMAKANPEKVITRNFYRIHSRYAESAWNAHFGTFHEFKRQAGIILSRHAHRVERQIAKHASTERMREMNAEKGEWSGAYKRKFNGRWQTVLVCSDIHDIDCDPFYRRLLVETARRVQPEKIVFNGDIFDLPEFSKYTQDPREFQPVERIQWVHKLFFDMREAAPNAEMTMVEGNHEFRLLRHLSEATPALMTVLSDLHGLTIPDLLGLDNFEINFVARADLAAFTERDVKQELKKNYVIQYDAVLFHHFPEGFQMGYPGCNGHHHKHLVKHAYSPTFGPYEWHQLGAGHRRQATYCAGEKWSNGFMLCHVDTHTRRTQFEYIDTSHDHCYIGGTLYERDGDESRPDAAVG